MENALRIEITIHCCRRCLNRLNTKYQTQQKKQTKTCNSVNVNDWHRRIPLMNSSNVTLGLPSNKEWNQNELFQMMCPSIKYFDGSNPSTQIKKKTPNGNKRSRVHKRRSAAVRLHHLHHQGCQTVPFPHAHLPYAGPASIFWSF